MSDVHTRDEQKRYILLPIRNQTLWDIFKQQQSVIWTTEEIDFAQDGADWASLSESEQKFILHIIAFFAFSDMLIVDNLMGNFMNEVKTTEAVAFYALQNFTEVIHSETYATLLDKFAPEEDRESLFNAIETMPHVRGKLEWAKTYMDPSKSFAARLWAFTIYEGVLFSASFCSIYWLRTKNKCPGLTYSNELIARDEGLHATFGVAMYNMLENPLTQEEVHEILSEAMVHEELFVETALPDNLVGMNKELMTEYVHYCANHLLAKIKGPGGISYAPLYPNATQPFSFMDMISLDGKTNFFEKRVAEYTRAGVGVQQGSTFECDDDDF